MTIIDDIKKFLRTKIISNRWIHIDYWSFIHFAVGWILWSRFGLSLVATAFILILYELIEPSFTFFRAENRVDMLWDVKFGLLGYAFASGII